MGAIRASSASSWTIYSNALGIKEDGGKTHRQRPEPRRGQSVDSPSSWIIGVEPYLGIRSTKETEAKRSISRGGERTWQRYGRKDNFSIHSEGREFPPKGSTSVKSLLSEMGSRELNKMRKKNHSRRSRARKEDGERVLP